MDLFGLSATVTLFDLTNTYFEGDAGQQPLARHGHSKETVSPRLSNLRGSRPLRG